MSQNNSVSDPVMNELNWGISSTRTEDRWYEHVWTENLNEADKLKFSWFLIVYVKRWADKD